MKILKFIEKLLSRLCRNNVEKEKERNTRLIVETYETFSNLLGSTGLDQWWTDISNVPRKQQEILAVSWIHILEFAERTGTQEILKTFQEEEYNFIKNNCGSNEMGIFTRAELCYEVFFPDGHKKK